MRKKGNFALRFTGPSLLEELRNNSRASEGSRINKTQLNKRSRLPKSFSALAYRRLLPGTRPGHADRSENHANSGKKKAGKRQSRGLR